MRRTGRQGSIVDRVAGKAAAFQEWPTEFEPGTRVGQSTGGLCRPAVHGAILQGIAGPAGCRRSHRGAGSQHLSLALPMTEFNAEYDGLMALDRMERAVEKIRDRLLRSTAALEAAGVPYAVIGGNAVMAWVEQVDESAVRFTQDVDLVLRREDLGRAAQALEKNGFVHRRTAGIEMFLDGPGAKARDAVHVIFSGEKVRPEYVAAVPDVSESTSFKTYRVLGLEPLVRMKLTSYRRKDQVHLLDMLAIGLIDATWPARFPPELAARLQQLIDTPDG